MGDSAKKIFKIPMIFFNFLYLVVGIAILIFSTTLYNSINDEYKRMLGDWVVIVPIVLIAVGGLISAVALFGCCGIIMDSYCCLIMFQVMLSTILLVAAALGILLMVFTGFVSDTVSDAGQSLQTTMKDYNSPVNETVTEAWDVLQQELNCCGVKTPFNWEDHAYLSNNSLPDSCCKENVVGCGKDALKYGVLDGNLYWTSGCTQVVEEFLSSKSVLLGGIFFGIAGFQLLGILLACCLMCTLKKSSYSV